MFCFNRKAKVKLLEWIWRFFHLVPQNQIHQVFLLFLMFTGYLLLTLYKAIHPPSWLMITVYHSQQTIDLFYLLLYNLDHIYTLLEAFHQVRSCTTTDQVTWLWIKISYNIYVYFGRKQYPSTKMARLFLGCCNWWWLWVHPRTFSQSKFVCLWIVEL